MRIDNKNNIYFISILVELCIFAVVGLVFLFQYSKAKEDFVTKTRAIAETIGDLSGSFFSDGNDNPSSDEFYHFLDERLGRKKLFNTFELAPKFFSVRFAKDINYPNENQGVFMRDVDPKAFKVENKAGVISVSVPFTIKDMLEPYGIIKIDSDKSAIAKKVLSDNFLLYVAMLVLFNNQAFIVFLLFRRKKEVVFEKGYLRENSLGALKIMHKLLGDMIVDNEAEHSDSKNGSKDDVDKSSYKKNVISISTIYDKKLK